MHKIVDFTILILFLILLMIVVALTVQNKSLKDKLDGVNLGGTASSLQMGDIVPSIQLTNIKGEATVFSYIEPQKRSVLFIFSTACQKCEENLVWWNGIHSLSNDRGWRIIGLSLDSVDKTIAFVNQKSIEYSVAVVSDIGFKSAYRIRGVPQTILLRGNKVVGIWLGVLNGDNITEIFREERK